MLQCSSCGAQCADGYKFCAKCGQRLQTPTEKPRYQNPPVPVKRRCPRCGLQWRMDAAFCGGCGTSFTGAMPARPSSSRCPACGAMLAAGQHFCGSCGMQQPMPSVCSRCGSTGRQGAHYCGKCGTLLPAGPNLSELCDESKRPHSISELIAWCTAAGVNPALTGFRIEEDPAQGDYCIHKKDGLYCFLKVMPGGGEHIFYRGHDEAFAVNGFWHTLLHRMNQWQPGKLA